MLAPETMRPSVVLAAYAEPLLDGRRVLVFGDATSGLAEMLLERGARLVHVCDPDASRVAEATARNPSRTISFAPLGDGALALREGAFDVGIIEDLGAAGPASSVLKRLRRSLTPRGVALVAVPNPDVRTRLLPVPGVAFALDYYQLYDAVKAEFPHVRMLGQTPFVGFAIVDFASNSTPDPSLDTAFVPGGAEEPEWFLAFASALPIRLDEFSVVQFPLSTLRSAAPPGASDEELAHAREGERRARDQMARLEAEVHELRGKLSAPRAPSVDPSVVTALQVEVAKRDAWISELESRASVADARADEAQAELDELRNRPREPDPEHVRKLAELSRELEALRTAARSEPVESGEVADLEARLVERGAEIRRLEAELKDTERLGRNLLDEVERLAEVNAEREADLQAARWTLQAGGNGSPDPDAQAELQRQAVLLGQLGR